MPSSEEYLCCLIGDFVTSAYKQRHVSAIALRAKKQKKDLRRQAIAASMTSTSPEARLEYGMKPIDLQREADYMRKQAEEIPDDGHAPKQLCLYSGHMLNIGFDTQIALDGYTIDAYVFKVFCQVTLLADGEEITAFQRCSLHMLSRRFAFLFFGNSNEQIKKARLNVKEARRSDIKVMKENMQLTLQKTGECRRFVDILTGFLVEAVAHKQNNKEESPLWRSMICAFPCDFVSIEARRRFWRRMIPSLTLDFTFIRKLNAFLLRICPTERVVHKILSFVYRLPVEIIGSIFELDSTILRLF
jgi:hypothetical protein